MDSNDAAVGLADAIATLRQELLEAMSEGQGQGVQFKLGPVELEVQLHVEKKGGVNGGVKWYLISVGGSFERSSGGLHRLKLTLEPVDSKGGDVTIRSRSGTRQPPP